MEIEIKIDSAYTKPKLVIYTAEMSNDIKAILDNLAQDVADTLVGFDGDMASLLAPTDIVRIYAQDKKVYADTHEAKFVLRMRLYEAETRLDRKNFVRISNAEIINLREVEKMDLSFTGTICFLMRNGSTAFVSRRYVAKIKTKLGL